VLQILHPLVFFSSTVHGITTCCKNETDKYQENRESSSIETCGRIGRRNVEA
jgi:hypothetical protein